MRVSCPRTQRNNPGQGLNPDHSIWSPVYRPWDHRVYYKTQNSQQRFTVFLLPSLTAICVSPSASSEDEKPIYLWCTVFSDLSSKLVRNLIGPENKRITRDSEAYNITNRFHDTMHMFSNWSQMTTKCGYNKKVDTRQHLSMSLMCMSASSCLFWISCYFSNLNSSNSCYSKSNFFSLPMRVTCNGISGIQRYEAVLV